MAELPTLVTRAASGDLDAYGEIVRRFQDMAFGYAYAVLGDFHSAEDVAQESFLAAYRQLGKLREPEAFPGWFRRVVMTQCHRRTRRKELGRQALEWAGSVLAREAGPVETAERRDMADRVLAAVRALPDNERAVTTLFYINGYSQQEVAEFLEVPVTTVNSRLHASRKRLREEMVTMVEDTLKDRAPGENMAAEVKARLLARDYRLDGAEAWRWVEAWPEHVARFRHADQEYVVRILPADAEPERLRFVAEFVGWLHGQGLAGETVAPAASGESWSRLPNGEAAMLLALNDGTLRSEEVRDEEEARRMGEFVGRLVTACQAWTPTARVPALMLRDGPEKVIARALRAADRVPEARRTLEEHSEGIRATCQGLLDDSGLQPVHGCVWWGGLLRTPTGPKAVDFRFSGLAPRVFDVAHAFRHLPWRDAPGRAAHLWEAWREGFSARAELLDGELQALPALASLQGLWWLDDEVETAEVEGAPPEELAWYVTDHCSTIAATMARTQS